MVSMWQPGWRVKTASFSLSHTHYTIPILLLYFTFIHCTVLIRLILSRPTSIHINRITRRTTHTSNNMLNHISHYDKYTTTRRFPTYLHSFFHSSLNNITTINDSVTVTTNLHANKPTLSIVYLKLMTSLFPLSSWRWTSHSQSAQYAHMHVTEINSL